MLHPCRGYTRKEPFANGIWTPKAENWNGRTAMIGFTGIIITEALAGKSVLEVLLGHHNLVPGIPQLHLLYSCKCATVSLLNVCSMG